MKSKSAPKKNPKKSLNYALWLIGRRARTYKEIEEKLARKGFERAEVVDTIRELEKLKLLDDKEFALSYIRASKSLKPKGRYRLRLELVKHGVDKNIAELALDEELGETNELSEEALKSYLKRAGSLPKQKLYQRSMGFLLRRGFSLDEAKKTVKKFLTLRGSSDSFDL